MAGSAHHARRSVHLARCFAYGGLGLGVAGVAQAVHLRLSYIPPEEPTGQRSGHAGKGHQGAPLRLLFVGDSVCMGVGAKIAAPLQNACAERLAALRERPVVWKTVAATGADVREMLAMFKARQASEREREREATAAEAAAAAAATTERRGAFDIAVVLCGVNDGKKLLEGRLPSVFRQDLDSLCAALRQAAPDGRISVPCIPGYTGAPLLQLWPMRFLVGPFFHQFESQKEVLAASAALHCPSPPEGSLPGPTDVKLWSADGIHPSGEGYQIIGEWLGSALAIA